MQPDELMIEDPRDVGGRAHGLARPLARHTPVTDEVLEEAVAHRPTRAIERRRAGRVGALRPGRRREAYAEGQCQSGSAAAIS